MREIRIFLAGFGTVGKGFAELLERKQELFRANGIAPRIIAISNSRGTVINSKGIGLVNGKLEDQGKWIEDNGTKLIKESEADLLVEATPTNVDHGEPGLENIRAALKSGKHVITSNKGPLVVDFQGLEKLAQEQGVLLRYEATVAAAIPLFSMHRNSLRASRIDHIRGIVNGTTNYILSKMHEENLPFEIALKDAIEFGYAEKDYSYDVDGKDAAAKAVILANSILGERKSYSEVKVTGIRNITKQAVELAKENGFVIKLIAEVSRDGLEVSPRLIPRISPLNVSGSLNAVQFSTDMAKDLYLTGRGAGKIETAGAMGNDLFEVVRDSERG